MPNISETSVGDISLSPAWNVMIVFLSWMQSESISARRVSVATWVQSPDRSTDCGLATVKDLSREATAGGRRETRIEVA